MDRLQKEEIHQVIRLIRDTAAFNNTIFIATYDKDYVSKAFEELSGNEAHRYLEKIFQVEYDLPYIDSYILRKRLTTELQLHFQNNYQKEFDSLLSPIFQERFPMFDKFVYTIRDVARFINLFAFQFKRVEDEVDFTDYFNLTLLKSKYHYIPRLLYDNYESFINDEDQFLSLRLETGVQRNNFFETNTVSDNSDRELIKKTVLFKFLEKMPNNGEAELLIKAIGDLFDFPIYEDDRLWASVQRSEKSISKKFYFYKYFSNMVFSTDISTEEYNELLHLISVEFSNKCKHVIDRGARLILIEKFEHDIYSEDMGIFIKIFTAFIELSIYKSPYEKNVLYPYPYYKLHDCLKRGIAQFHDKDVEKYLMDLLDRDDLKEYNMDFIKYIGSHGDFNSTQSLINTESLLGINLKYLKESLENNDDFPTSSHIYENCIGISTNINIKATNLLLENFLQKGIIKFAHVIIEKDATSYRINDLGAKIFDKSFPKITEFINRFDDSVEKQILLNFIKELEKAGKAIPYDLEKLKF